MNDNSNNKAIMFPENQVPGYFSNVQTTDGQVHIMEPAVVKNFVAPDKKYKEYPLFSNEDIKKNYAFPMLKGAVKVNMFSLLYFSKQNIKTIQDVLRYNVKKITNEIIGPQDETILVVSMRKVFLENSRLPSSKERFTDEIARLNQIVVNTCLRHILTEISSYKKYLFDIENNAYSDLRGTDTSIKGTNPNRDLSETIFAQTTNLFS